MRKGLKDSAELTTCSAEMKTWSAEMMTWSETASSYDSQNLFPMVGMEPDKKETGGEKDKKGKRRAERRKKWQNRIEMG